MKNGADKLIIQKRLGDTYNEIGKAKVRQGFYPEALTILFTALKIREAIQDKEGISYTQNNIGIVYYFLSNYDDALKYYFASLKIREELGDKIGIASSNNNIGSIYNAQHDFEKANKHFTIFLKISNEVDDKAGIAMAYENIGVLKQDQGNYEGALSDLFAALKIYDETGDKFNIPNVYINIGNSYLFLKKYKEAYQYLNRGLSISKESGAQADMALIYNSLSDIDKAQGNYQQSLTHYKLYIAARDSLYNEENTKKIVQTQMQYDFDKKETAVKAEQDKKDAIAKKELQKQKLVRNGFVGGFSIVLLFAGIFFSQRNKIKKGKKRSDELLLNILPSEVAEELKTKGSADAKQFNEVTVMFTDFKNFTQISEKLSPAELVSEIHTCFKAFDNIIGKHNIEKIKTIGDSYMCAGGLPVANTTHATDVVKAAIEIQQFMQQHLQQQKKENKEPFEIRIGVHTGPVVAGIVGVKKFAYDIWGDTVNIASRMESSSEAGKVNISGSTYELVKDKFNCIYRGKIKAKHKGEIDMYFVDVVS